MVFLATPHRGSTFAAMLNNILRASPGGSAKNYVAELERLSGSLQDINELFRNICGNLKLVSFHETIKTNLGAGIKKMVSAGLSLLSVLGILTSYRSSTRTPPFLSTPAKSPAL